MDTLGGGGAPAPCAHYRAAGTEVRDAHLEAVVLQVLQRTWFSRAEVETRHERLRNRWPRRSDAERELVDERIGEHAA